MERLSSSQMKELRGGFGKESNSDCTMSMGMAGIVGGILFGPIGYIGFAAWDYYMNPVCDSDDMPPKR